MPAAARVGDLTGHGTPLGPGPGSLDVLIGGQPAWLAQMSTHACPLVNVAVPHGGGVVAMGSVTVRINKVAAVRMGDQVVEVGGGPNPIAAGLPNVMIGG